MEMLHAKSVIKNIIMLVIKEQVKNSVNGLGNKVEEVIMLLFLFKFYYFNLDCCLIYFFFK